MSAQPFQSAASTGGSTATMAASTVGKKIYVDRVYADYSSTGPLIETITVTYTNSTVSTLVFNHDFRLGAFSQAVSINGDTNTLVKAALSEGTTGTETGRVVLYGFYA